MNIRTWSSLRTVLLLALMGTFLTNCSYWSPNARKQRYYNSAVNYFEKGKYREATIQLENAIKLDPEFADAHYRLAQCYEKLGLWPGAYAELSRTVGLAPRNWNAQVDLGNLLLAGGRYKEAQEKAKLVLIADSQHVDAHILMANAMAALGNRDDAVEEMQKAIRLAPTRPNAYVNLAVLQSSANQTSAAEESYKKAISLDRKSVNPVMALAAFYGRQRRFQEAKQECQHAIELDPKDPAPRRDLALVYLAERNEDGAIEVLKQAKRALGDNPEGYRMLGDFLIRTRQVAKALDEYASLYKEHPKDAAVKRNYILLLIERYRLDEATKLNDEVLKRNPRDPDALIAKGKIWIYQDRANDAIPLLESALKTDPNNAVGHYYLGVAYNRVGKVDLAMSEWKEAARLRPEMADAQEDLARAAQQRGDIDQLSQSAEALIGNLPSSPLGYSYRAYVKARHNDPAGVEADLKKAIEVAPQNPFGYTRLGQWRTAQKRFKEAEALYEDALKRDPDFTEALAALVRTYLLQKQTNKAIARVEEQTRKAPKNSSYYALLGRLYAGQKDLGNSEQALQKAVELDKKNVDAFITLGQIQIGQGERDKAMATYQQLLAQNPREVRSYAALGTLEESAGNWQKAEDLYRQALGIDPNYAIAANDLAYAMLEHGGNTDAALSLAQTARRGLPDSPGAADTLAWAYYQKGVYQSAIDLLEGAVKKVPNDPSFHYHLGLAYEKVKDKSRAKQHLERALALDPKFVHADDIRKALAELSRG